MVREAALLCAECEEFIAHAGGASHELDAAELDELSALAAYGRRLSRAVAAFDDEVGELIATSDDDDVIGSCRQLRTDVQLAIRRVEDAAAPLESTIAIGHSRVSDVRSIRSAVDGLVSEIPEEDVETS